jgi:hypothetical protein
MRLTEFWSRMEDHLGATYATSFAHDHVITELDGLTVDQALEAGVETKLVWRAVVSALNLPASAR